MSYLWRYFALMTLVVVVLPGIIVVVGGWLAPPPKILDNPMTINLYLTATSQVITLPLEEYVAGVVAAEMPAEFGLAALQAQAVAARTYVVRRTRSFGGAGCDRHPLADVCDNPAHCQAYLSRSGLQLKWGMINFNRHMEKILQAVFDTAGLILTYGGRAIDPIYHSTCGGMTEFAEKVWSNSYPYLSGRACEFCRHSNRLTERRTFALAEFVALINQEGGAVLAVRDLTSRPPQIEILRRSASGRVKEIRVGRRELTGTALRGLLGLRSTNFTIAVGKDGVVIETRGHGHGVGMCQWGSDGLADAGKDFEYILKFYYRGVRVQGLDDR